MPHAKNRCIAELGPESGANEALFPRQEFHSPTNSAAPVSCNDLFPTVEFGEFVGMPGTLVLLTQ